ncbi:alkyl/aryl-sulfatase [soil metagenome]
MADLLALADRYLDGDEAPPPRIIQELSEVADGIALVESFSNVVALAGGDGLVVVDTSTHFTAEPCRAALRGWSDAPVRSIVYTHGHLDHVGGGQVFVDEAAARGDARPAVVGHENVAARIDRYELTNGYNAVINARQFGQGAAPAGRFGPERWVRPDLTFAEHHTLDGGGLTVELRHARGETDDHAWAWLPEQRAICAGDFMAWVFPNAGNPQKVQRYPLEWAAALRDMAAHRPALLLPAHGLPIGGEDRIVAVLEDLAGALESLVAQTLELMNAGATVDTIIHTVGLPAELLAKPYLQPIYDEPEFVVRNIWRLYGGWYDGRPDRLKPAPDAALAAELAALAGGGGHLVARAQAVAAEGDLRLARHLVELAVLAAPDDAEAHGARAELYRARVAAASSLMAKGIFGHAAAESADRAELT